MRLPPTEGPTLRDDSDLIQFPYISKIRMQLDDIKSILEANQSMQISKLKTIGEKKEQKNGKPQQFRMYLLIDKDVLHHAKL